MKKITIIVTAMALTTATFALEIQVESGDAFNKVMSKNRSSKNMEGSNYVEIKNNAEFKSHGQRDLGITIDGNHTTGTVYNYVEVKNVKSTKNKFTNKDKKATNKYNDKNSDNKRNIGVKIKIKEGFNRGFKGKVRNTVKIENSDLD